MAEDNSQQQQLRQILLDRRPQSIGSYLSPFSHWGLVVGDRYFHFALNPFRCEVFFAEADVPHQVLPRDSYGWTLLSNDEIREAGKEVCGRGWGFIFYTNCQYHAHLLANKIGLAPSHSTMVDWINTHMLVILAAAVPTLCIGSFFLVRRLMYISSLLQKETRLVKVQISLFHQYVTALQKGQTASPATEMNGLLEQLVLLKAENPEEILTWNPVSLIRFILSTKSAQIP